MGQLQGMGSLLLVCKVLGFGLYISLTGSPFRI